MFLYNISESEEESWNGETDKEQEESRESQEELERKLSKEWHISCYAMCGQTPENSNKWYMWL